MSRRADELNTTSFAMLGMLAIRPWSTYELAKHVDRSLRRVLHAFDSSGPCRHRAPARPGHLLERALPSDSVVWQCRSPRMSVELDQRGGPGRRPRAASSSPRPSRSSGGIHASPSAS